MKKLLLLPLLIVSLCADSDAATRPVARGSRGASGAAAPATGGAGGVSKSVNRGRAATNTPAKTPAAAAPAAAAPKTVNRGRAATNTPAKGPTVAARAGTMQKVVGTGTKVASAAKNVVVNEECQQKFEGCMDAFCMLDNASGGRCMCSDKNAEYDAILAEIEKLDQQSYQMATFGVERIEMGNDADAAIAAANAAAKAVTDEGKAAEAAENAKKTSRRTLDLSMWDDSALELEEDVFASSQNDADVTGDALYKQSLGICVEKIPECAAEMEMLQMLYGQRIKADCTAYENTLKQQKKSSQQKLQTAERALREAALDQLKTANKYDLGQCTIEFKKCMQTTGGCGNDFAGCAVAAAMDATNVVKSTSKKTKKQNTYQIKGAITNIEISASTYDNLMAKKPLCESVTKQCVAVADQVWDTFLREVAPQMKSAELIAENNARQNCIGNISSCFQKACKDNIDPKDPDGSYDMCLTRPATMLNVCKVPLNACGIDATSEAAAQQSDIWNFVLAALAAQRVDSCTTAVKECLTSADRCGKDYSQCIGLDLDSLKGLCPLEKLVACQDKSNGKEETVWEDFANIVQGIWLNIDNSMLTQCKNIVNKRMIEICGSSAECLAFEDDVYMGTDSLSSHTTKDGDHVIEGLISFGNVKIAKAQSKDDDVKFGMYEVNIQDYKKHLDEGVSEERISNRVIGSLQTVATKIEQKIALLTQDPEVQLCVNGRDMKQIRGKEAEKTSARFPNLLDSSILAIITAGLDQANKNYNVKYNELVGKALESYDDAVKSVLCASMATSAEPKCTEYATSRSGEAKCRVHEANNIDNIFKDKNTDAAGLSGSLYATTFTIPGIKVSDLAAAQSKGHGNFINTDSEGNFVSGIAMTAAYSSANNTCTITTVTTGCEDMKDIVITDTTHTCDYATGGIGGGGCRGGGGIGYSEGSYEKTVDNTFEGMKCAKYMEPVTTTTTIKM